MKRIGLFFTIFIYSIVLFAQTDFRPGYVIKSLGDTLWGEINYQGNKELAEMCTFRTNKNSKITYFAPEDILGYRFVNSKYFVSKQLVDKTVFLEYLINGIVSIYCARYDDGNHFYIEKEGKGLMELPYKEGIIEKYQKKIFFTSTEHIGILQIYMGDATELSEKIYEITEPKQKELMKLAEEYHNIVCSGSKCIIYEKKLSPISINPQFTYGLSHITNQLINSRSKSFQTFMPTFGILMHIWLPNVSEKLYLKTGLIGVIDGNNKNMFSLFKIPFYLEYLYPKGIIRPRCSIGISNITFDPGFSGGLNIKLYKQLNFSIDYNIDFFSKENGPLNFPDSFLSHSLSCGLYLCIP